MSKQRIATPALTLAILGAVAVMAQAGQEGAVTSAGPHASSLQEAKELAAETGLPILIDFYADW